MMSCQSLMHGLGIAGECVAAVDAGIVDQDRDRPDLLGDAPGDRDAILALADVELETLGLAARSRISCAASSAAVSFKSSSATCAPSRA